MLARWSILRPMRMGLDRGCMPWTSSGAFHIGSVRGSKAILHLPRALTARDLSRRLPKLARVFGACRSTKIAQRRQLQVNHPLFWRTVSRLGSVQIFFCIYRGGGRDKAYGR